ncbi:MAG TPA: YiiX/YebB-like N1pC/P60 family cysteine hydrolase [Stenomitos sp.]
MFRLEGSLNSIFTHLFPSRPAPKPQAAGPAPTLTADSLALSPPASTAPAAPAVPEAPPKTDGLTDEEIGFLKEGLLPKNYSDLKACLVEKGREAAKDLARKGIQGPFANDYGDPVAMLDCARRLHDNPELMRLAKNIKKGDILVETWNSDDNLISSLTKGPFVHSVICVAENPPEFIEAMGITGASNEPDGNQVRRACLANHAYKSLTTRILRPTEGMDPAEASKAVDRAVRYAEGQLGKPYDYSFTDHNEGTGLTDAYYCSELTYIAYESPKGGNINLPLQKSPERDSLLVAIGAMVTALDPKNQAELMDRTVKLLNRNPKPGTEELVKFLVDEVMTSCRTTENVTKTPKDRQQLQKAIMLLLQGKAFPSFDQAVQAYKAAEANHEFDEPLIGFEKKQAAKASIAAAFSVDTARLFGTSGINYYQAIKTSKTLVTALLPYSETFAGYLFGPKDSRTESVGKLLDTIDWVKAHAPKLPIVGDLGLSHLPARAKPQIKKDFVSPSDLAWADVPHSDFNVKPNHPLDPPKP